MIDWTVSLSFRERTSSYHCLLARPVLLDAANCLRAMWQRLRCRCECLVLAGCVLLVNRFLRLCGLAPLRQIVVLDEEAEEKTCAEERREDLV